MPSSGFFFNGSYNNRVILNVILVHYLLLLVHGSVLRMVEISFCKAQPV